MKCIDRHIHRRQWVYIKDFYADGYRPLKTFIAPPSKKKSSTQYIDVCTLKARFLLFQSERGSSIGCNSGICQLSEPTDSLGQTYAVGQENRSKLGMLHIHGMILLYCNNNTHTLTRVYRETETFGKLFPSTLNNCKMRF